jgi:hypothetical protein
MDTDVAKSDVQAFSSPFRCGVKLHVLSTPGMALCAPALSLVHALEELSLKAGTSICEPKR